MQPLAPGDTLSWQRTFSDEDVARFAELTGDRGRHHVERDARGRLMVHGLLTASIPTKLGGDLHFLARELRFEFVRPVWSGDTIRCALTIATVEPQPGRRRVTMTLSCLNQKDQEVMRGSGDGVILDEPGA